MYNPQFVREKIADFIQNTLGIQVSHEVRIFMAGTKLIGALNTIEQKTLFYGKVNVSYSEQLKTLWIFKLRGQVVYVVDTTSPEYAQFQKEVLFDEVYLSDSITEVAQNYAVSAITYNSGVVDFNLRLIGGGRTLLYGFYDQIGVLAESANLLDGAAPGVLDVRAFHRYFMRPVDGGFEAGYTFIKQGEGIYVTDGQLIDLSLYIGAGGTFTLQYLTGQMSGVVDVVEVGCSLIQKRVVHAGLNVVLPGVDNYRYSGLTNYKFLISQSDGSVVVRMKDGLGAVMQTLAAVPVLGGYFDFTLANTGMASSAVMELIYTAASVDTTNIDFVNYTGSSLTVIVDSQSNNHAINQSLPYACLDNGASSVYLNYGNFETYYFAKYSGAALISRIIVPGNSGFVLGSVVGITTIQIEPNDNLNQP